jgi:DNA adenine methylase
VLNGEDRTAHLQGNHLYVFYKKFEHERLFECVRKHKGRFMLSYNKCDMIKELYKDYNQDFPVWRNSIKRHTVGRRTYNSDEILITNY